VYSDEIRKGAFMFSIIGRLDKSANLMEGFNADHIVSFKISEKEKKATKDDPTEKVMTITVSLSDGSKETFEGDEAKVLFDKVLLKNLHVSVNAVQIGSANRMLNTLQTQMAGARVKAEKESKDKAKAKEASGFRRMI
jgi:hypothetical protein